ncbi:unnamed protein product [Rhodiola kirilowii]
MPPDIRVSSKADSLASLAASFADLAARTQAVESSVAAKVAKAAAESARNASTFERVLGMLDQLSTSVKEIQRAARNAEKQPMQAPNVTTTPPPHHTIQPVFGSYGSSPRFSPSTAIPLAIDGNQTITQRLPSDTPLLSPIAQPIFGSYGSTQRLTSSTHAPLAIDNNSAIIQCLSRHQTIEHSMFQLTLSSTNESHINPSTHTVTLSLLPSFPDHFNTGQHHKLRASAEFASFTRGQPKRTSRKHSISPIFQPILSIAPDDHHALPTPVRDWGLSCLQLYRQSLLHSRRSPKLAQHYYGLFRIIERIGRVAYCLALLLAARIHDVTLGQFKRASRMHPITRADPVIDSCSIVHRDQLIPRIRVVWKGQQVENSTWEDVADLRHDYLEIHLEVEVPTEGGSNVTPRGDMADLKGGNKRARRELHPPKHYPKDNSY